jgi:hypothetical protein
MTNKGITYEVWRFGKINRNTRSIDGINLSLLFCKLKIFTGRTYKNVKKSSENIHSKDDIYNCLQCLYVCDKYMDKYYSCAQIAKAIFVKT